MNILGNKAFMIGDLVQYKGRGGSKRTRENVWEIIGFRNDNNFRHGLCPSARVCLVKGLINDSSNHNYGPGYERYYFLKDLKYVEEAE